MTKTTRSAEPSDLEATIEALREAESEKDALIKDLEARLAAAEDRLDTLKNQPAKHVEYSKLQVASEMRHLAHCRNGRVKADTDRLSPMYSTRTGEQIALCPKTVADLVKMDSSQLKPLLEALGTLPLDRTDQEMKEAVASRMGVSALLLRDYSEDTD